MFTFAAERLAEAMRFEVGKERLEKWNTGSDNTQTLNNLKYNHGPPRFIRDVDNFWREILRCEINLAGDDRCNTRSTRREFSPWH